jgi:hypothetical protein
VLEAVSFQERIDIVGRLLLDLERAAATMFPAALSFCARSKQGFAGDTSSSSASMKKMGAPVVSRIY